MEHAAHEFRVVWPTIGRQQEPHVRRRVLRDIKLGLDVIERRLAAVDDGPIDRYGKLRFCLLNLSVLLSPINCPSLVRLVLYPYFEGVGHFKHSRHQLQ